MPNSKLINIVTVTFNCVDHIENTLLSIKAQDYPNMRVIVIDGGSTDGTLEILRSYEYLLDVFISENDEGIYDAMNKSIQFLAPGIVNYLNAGDVYSDYRTLSRVVDSFGDKTVFLWGDIARFDGDEICRAVSQRRGLVSFGKIHQICHQSAFFLVDKSKLVHDINLSICSDFLVLVRYWFSSGDKTYLATPLVKYLNGGISDTNQLLLIDEKIAVICHHWPKPIERVLNVAYLKILKIQKLVTS